MVETGAISGTLQDYLETILKLERDKGAARVRDIAGAMSVHKSTVTSALKHLSDKRLVNYAPYEMATLTDAGRRVAEETTQNHRVIRRFLRRVLLIDDDMAESNACRMEHVMDQAVMDRLVQFAAFIERRSAVLDRGPRRFADYVENGAGSGRPVAGKGRAGGSSCRKEVK